MSRLAPASIHSYARYTTDEMLKDLEVLFHRYRHPSDNVFVAHSYGTSLVAFLLQRLPREVTETVRACAMCSPTLEGPSGVLPFCGGLMIHVSSVFLRVPGNSVHMSWATRDVASVLQ
jgi:pimeloyl-ACP methyl ester carboxylesterase